ncbi:LysM peptidoglycan-binding domain-containing protein [Marisediminicola sp. LYQ85]|uniref:LysM peptidoglycan-binding domain-containing protein n=1 Tax=Marisediminicola sp. LYQ85 TaxID=3391062 RepID=UPI003983D90A
MPQRRLRLTRRGRAVFTALVAAPIVLAAGAFALNGGMATASNEDGADVVFVQVESGESLWELAVGLAPEADPREVVSDLVHFNQLDSADVQPGQKLAVPAAYAR